MQDDKAILKVGIVSFILAIAIAILLIWKSGLFLRATGYEVIGEFQNISGLLKGAEVRYRGYQVGRVSKILPTPENIRVHFWVETGVDIPVGSTIRVVFDGLIGEKYLQIIPNPEASAMISEGDVLLGYASSGLADFVHVGTENLEQTRAIVESLRDIITSEDVGKALRNTVIDFERITSDLSKLIRVLNPEKVEDIVISIRETSDSLRRGVNGLVGDGELQRNLSQVSQDLAAMAENLRQLSQNLEDKELIEKTDRIITSLAEFSENLNHAFDGNQMKEGMDGLGGLVRQAGGVLRVLSDIRLSSDLGLRYNIPESYLFYDANVDIGNHGGFLRFGIGDRLGSTQFLNLQAGSYFTDSLRGRIGLFYTEPGLGLDYYFNGATLSFEVFDLNRPEFDILGRYRILDAFHIGVGLTKDRQTSEYNNVNVGIFYNPGL